MRSWQIIAASAATAAIAEASLFLPGALPWRPETVALLLRHWPAIAVIWFGSYGCVALVLTTLTVFLEMSRPAPGRAEQGWARHYVARLAVSQYFTSVLALLGLGLSRVPVETAPFLVLPGSIGGSAALAACGVVVGVGVLGGLLLTATPETAELPEPGAPVPAIRADRLVREITELQRDQAPIPAHAPVDVARLAELIERGHRSILEAVRDLAIAVNRLRWGLDEIKIALQDRAPERSSEVDPAAQSAAEGAAEIATNELRAVAAAVHVSVAKLEEMAALLSANETQAVAGRNAPPAPASRSQLSTELQALLRDMTPAGDNRDLPR